MKLSSPTFHQDPFSNNLKYKRLFLLGDKSEIFFKKVTVNKNILIRIGKGLQLPLIPFTFFTLELLWI